MSEKSGQSLPGFMSTHPDPGDRNVRVKQLADEWQQQIQYQPLHKQRHDYLKLIAGIVYGDDPRQGYTEDGMFYHPTMRFQFPIPADWRLVNSPSTVLMVSPDKKAVVQLRLGEGESTDQVADAFVEKNGVTVRSRRRTTIHGFPATVVQSGLKNEEQDLLILSTFIEKDGNIYAFHGYSAATVFTEYAGSFRTVMDGFEEVRDTAVLEKKPHRVYIKEVRASGRLSSAFRDLGVSEDMYEELAILNGLGLDDGVEKGYWLKLVGE
jgi:predicted Zn-dependent protease